MRVRGPGGWLAVARLLALPWTANGASPLPSRSSTTPPKSPNVTLRDGRQVVSGSSVPWTWQIAEAFKIDKGLIGPVESVLHPVPCGMGSGWSTWEDAMSSRPH